MLKKLIAMTIVTTMLLSSFCIIAQADYGYNWGDVIAKKIGGNSTDNGVNQNAGDDVSYKNHRFLGAEAVRDLYFLYNYDEATDKYIRDDADNTGKADAPYFALDDYYPRIMSNFKTKTFGFKTTGHQGKYFFTQKNGIPTLYLSKKSNVTLNTSPTMTYEFSIKYAEGTDIPLTQFKIYTKSNASPEISTDNAFYEEEKAFLDLVIDGKECSITSPESIYDSVRLVMAELDSAKSGSKVMLSEEADK